MQKALPTREAVSWFMSRNMSALVLLIASLIATTCDRHLASAQAITSPTSSGVGHDVAKRFFPASKPILGGIMEKFHVYSNTIIRTADSRASGARYLDERKLNATEECVYLCWQTSPCNLAVFEGKTSGSCYLFDCGPIENSRCKFTAHSSYSSSTLKQNRQDFELNQWSAQSKHEDELAGLRGSSVVGAAPGSGVSRTSATVASVGSPTASGLIALQATSSPVVRSVGPLPTPQSIQLPANQPLNVRSRCQHYQYACRNSTDCIAIYNVCDGIPQCPDGSDEAADLHCPEQGGAYGWTPMSVARQQPTPTAPSMKANTLPQGPTGVAFNQQGPARRVDGPGIAMPVSKPSSTIYKYPKAPEAFPGESEQKPNEIGPSAFGHKYSAFVPAKYDKSSNYYKQQPQQQAPQQYQPWNPYYPQQNEYYSAPEIKGGYIDENDYPREPSAVNSPIFWPLPDRNPNGGQPIRAQPPFLSGLDHSKDQQQLQQWSSGGDVSGNFRSAANFGPLVPNKNKADLKDSSSQVAGINPGLKSAPTPTITAVTTSAAPTLKPSAVYAKLAANQVPSHAASMAISHLHDSNSSGRDTNSAVIALTLGLCITAMLVALVGCRMKSIRRRIARRGRNLTHDADYLVNGMYL